MRTSRRTQAARPTLRGSTWDMATPCRRWRARGSIREASFCKVKRKWVSVRMAVWVVEERRTGVEDGRQTLRPLPHSLTHSLTDESAGAIDFMWPVLYMPIIHLVASCSNRTPRSSTSFSFPFSLAAPNLAVPRCASSNGLRCNAPVIPGLPRGHADAMTHLHSASALDLHPLPTLDEVA
jgi:hypothetical protein